MQPHRHRKYFQFNNAHDCTISNLPKTTHLKIIFLWSYRETGTQKNEHLIEILSQK